MAEVQRSSHRGCIICTENNQLHLWAVYELPNFTLGRGKEQNIGTKDCNYSFRIFHWSFSYMKRPFCIVCVFDHLLGYFLR